MQNKKERSLKLRLTAVTPALDYRVTASTKAIVREKMIVRSSHAGPA
jgi:hypothetical protein